MTTQSVPPQESPAPAAAAETTANVQGAGSDDHPQDAKGGQSGKPRSKKALIILAVVIVVLAIGAFIYWFATRNELTTDDAFIDGDAVTMAPKVTGYVIGLYIDDNVRVRKGDLLLSIDPRDYLEAQAEAHAQVTLARAQLEAAKVALSIARIQYPAQLRAARAQRQAAKASFAQAQAAYRRQHRVDPRATTEGSIDAADSQRVSASANVQSAQAQLQVADTVVDQLRQAAANVAERAAQLEQAQAQLAQAGLELSYCNFRAPVDGIITKRNVQLGTYLSAGTTMFLIVTPDVWVTANFKETQLHRMRRGDAVDLSVDAYPALKLRGHVDSIQSGSGSRFSAFPPENATGNFVKVVQRVPVKIVIDRGLDPKRPLGLGLSVSPVVRLP